MSDVRQLIQNRVRGSLEQLERENIGHIDVEDYMGFRYCVDGRFFNVLVKEIGIEDEAQ
ncbi:MAG: hypothetical protein H2212_07205 [Ruminococcus sp.]|nr:hypothetical protein [Ruminococcus sp.]